jgi:hypothetical protein
MMKDMSNQMMEMSKTMGKGVASEHKMKTMQDQMMHMQKKMSEMGKKK